MVKVSVVIATYNGENFIESQLLSIINQSHVVNEIIISDDSSTDDTLKKARCILNKSSIDFLILQNRNKGVVNNFSNALRFVSGDVVFFSDQDDIWMDNKVEVILGIFKNNKDLLLCFSNAILFDDTKASNFFKTDLFQNSGFQNTDLFYSNPTSFLLKRSIVTGATMAISKKLLNMALPVGDFWMHDQWFSFFAALNDGIMFTDKKLIYYRQHENNVIGAVKTDLFSSFSRFIKNIKNLKKFRKVQKIKYESLYLSISPTVSDYYQIKDCFYFWNKLDGVSSQSTFQGLIAILYLFREGFYFRFYNGYKGLIRDLLSLFV